MSNICGSFTEPLGTTSVILVLSMLSELSSSLGKLALFVMLSLTDLLMLAVIGLVMLLVVLWLIFSLMLSSMLSGMLCLMLWLMPWPLTDFLLFFFLADFLVFPFLPTGFDWLTFEIGFVG